MVDEVRVPESALFLAAAFVMPAFMFYPFKSI